MVTKPIWPNGRFGVPQITPYTYRDGQTLLELITSIRDHVVEQLHPDLQKTIDKLVADVEKEYDKAHDRYVDGVQEFQRIHDAFISDVNASLIALNDHAVTDLVIDETSLLRKTLHEMYLGVEVKDELETTIDSKVHAFDEKFSLLEGQVHQSLTVSRDMTYTQVNYLQAGMPEHPTAQDLQDALDRTSDGVMITMPPDLLFTVHEPIVIRGDVSLSGGTFRHGAHSALQVHGNSVLDNVTCIGPGNTSPYIANTSAIDVQGKQDQYVSIVIRNCVITDQHDTGIHVEYVKDFLIENNTIHKFRYGGIMVMSGIDGEVRKNSTRFCNPAGNNSYGIAVSDFANTPQHRSRNVVVDQNTVEDIPNWEGLDTHGGHNIAFTNNVVLGCRYGIVLTVGASNRRTAPEQCRVIGNYVDNRKSESAFTTSGIMIGGTRSSHEHHPLPADAIITDNHVVNSHIPISYPKQITGSTVDPKLTYIGKNVSNEGYRLQGTDNDSGRLRLRDLGVFPSGWQPNAVMVPRVRVVEDQDGYTVYCEGAISYDGGGGHIYTFTDPRFIPGYEVYCFPTMAVGGRNLFLTLKSDGRLITSLHEGGGSITQNILFNGVFRIEKRS